MNGKWTLVGLCALCALVFSGLAAQSAVAGGTTAVTCKPVSENRQFSDAHCKTPQGGAGAGFRHIEIAENTTTEVTVTNEATPGETEGLRLRTIVAGVEFEILASNVHGVGTLHNIMLGGEHVITQTITTAWSKVEVVKPAGKGCVVREKEGGTVGTITTNSLMVSSEGQGMALKTSPTAGTQLASFFVEGCTVPALNGKKEISGSVASTEITGATSRFTEAGTTEQGTLHFGGATGPKAGLSCTYTYKGKHDAGGDPEYTPLAFTTTP